MISSSICVDCICLPVCLSKGHYKLTRTCSFITNALINISYATPIDDQTIIYFKGLDRTVTVNRSDHKLYVQRSMSRKHILKFMDPLED